MGAADLEHGDAMRGGHPMIVAHTRCYFSAQRTAAWIVRCGCTISGLVCVTLPVRRVARRPLPPSEGRGERLRRLSRLHCVLAEIAATEAVQIEQRDTACNRSASSRVYVSRFG
jgi:hypothetical protein